MPAKDAQARAKPCLPKRTGSGGTVVAPTGPASDLNWSYRICSSTSTLSRPRLDNHAAFDAQKDTDDLTTKDVHQEKIWLAKCSRKPKEFESALMFNHDLQHVRQDLQDHGHGIFCGPVKVFVWAHQYREAIDAFWRVTEEQQIHPITSHIIVSDSVLPNVEACIRSIPSRHSVRLKTGRIELTCCSTSPPSKPSSSQKDVLSENPAEASQKDVLSENPTEGQNLHPTPIGLPLTTISPAPWRWCDVEVEYDDYTAEG